MYTVCASAVISPLRQWLDSYAKTRLKMCHTFKHLFICNTFCCRLILLSLSLYIELALVCCMNPDNVNCFGTIFPNLNFVFASIWAARPVHIESDQYHTEVAQLSNNDPLSVLRHPPRLGSNQNSAVALGSGNNMISIQPEECADEWRQNNADLKLLENCLMNGFICNDPRAAGHPN